MRRIAIGIPAREDVKTKFASDLIPAVCNHLSQFPDDVVIPLFSEGTILCSQRTELVLEARRSEATRILFLDSDMRFPADMIGRMLAHDEMVVAANCARRKIPTGPTAGNYDANRIKTPVYTTPDKSGLERVNSVGTAVMLIDMEVFEQIPMPWFATPWYADKNCYMGEDVYFCQLLTQYEVPIMIDHDLSREIKHIGAFEFSHEHVNLGRALELGRAAEEKPAPLVVLQ